MGSTYTLIWMKMFALAAAELYTYKENDARVHCVYCEA